MTIAHSSTTYDILVEMFKLLPSRARHSCALPTTLKQALLLPDPSIFFKGCGLTVILLTFSVSCGWWHGDDGHDNDKRTFLKIGKRRHVSETAYNENNRGQGSPFMVCHMLYSGIGSIVPFALSGPKHLCSNL